MIMPCPGHLHSGVNDCFVKSGRHLEEDMRIDNKWFKGLAVLLTVLLLAGCGATG